jgi:hypothetical protein
MKKVRKLTTMSHKGEMHVVKYHRVAIAQLQGYQDRETTLSREGYLAKATRAGTQPIETQDLVCEELVLSSPLGGHAAPISKAPATHQLRY